MPGLPNHHTIHPRFQEYNAAMIAATFRSTVRVQRLADQHGTRDCESGRTAFATPYIVYDGPARIQSRGGGATARGPGGAGVGVGDREVTIGSYLVAVPAGVPTIKVHDLVEVLDVPDSPALNGQVLKVVDVPQADIAWQRNLGCDLHQPTVRG